MIVAELIERLDVPDARRVEQLREHNAVAVTPQPEPRAGGCRHDLADLEAADPAIAEPPAHFDRDLRGGQCRIG